MQWPLVLSGLALGAAATPHCAFMCTAPCAAVTRGGGRAAAGFHAGRSLGYIAAGAIAAGSVTLLARWMSRVPALHPLWTVLHLGFLGVGLWWLLKGQAPRWLMADATAVRTSAAGRSFAAGLAWVAWPCPALQASLMLAALANDAWGGGLVMAAFAAGSTPGLALAHRGWQALARRLGAGDGRVAPLGFRLAGCSLVAVSGWALTSGVWPAVAAWCRS